jgi:tetratricopeptide (TPR) repeat protein
VPGEPQAEELEAAEKAYDDGRLADAATRFEDVLLENPGSVPAEVGAALAAWPEGTLPALEALAGREPDSALVRLHLGLALAASGDGEAARREWRLAAERDPDTPAAVQADSLLHPDVAPGLPPFLLAEPLPAAVRRLPPLDQLTALTERAARGEASDHLALGALLQRLGRPVSARAAFERALALGPESVEARAAVAVGRFDKDEPARSFSELGPLARSEDGTAVVRYHLGLMLLWIRAVDEAERQLRQAIDLDPGSIYAREAEKLLQTLAPS